MSDVNIHPLYLIKFDDTEVPDETIFGAEIASKRFEQISRNWNAHLFVKVASNSRDDVCSGSNALLASDYDALAAQRDEGLAREAELRKTLAFSDENQIRQGLRINNLREEVSALQQRLAEAEKWVVYRWQAEVGNRPWVNVHRRSLDETWRQVMRHMGLDDRALCGLTHDELLARPGCADGEQPS